MKTSRAFVAGLVFLLCNHLSIAAERLFYGLLHSHTYLSDGSGTPEDAYHAAKTNGVAFFAVTEHNHKDAEDGASDDRRDEILISNNHRLYTNTTPVQITRLGQVVTVKSLRKAALDNLATDFLPIYGQEFSSISSGNHVNVLGIDEVITGQNGRFDLLFQRLAAIEAETGKSIVVQMNHPDVQMDFFYGGQDPKVIKKMFNDYGFDDFGENFADLVTASDRFVHLIEVLSGPKGTVNARFNSFHYHDGGGDNYYYYLCQGFHISPSVGHDDHYEHWGNKGPARMGVYAESLTTANLFEAFRQNRTFATEDRDLELRFSANGNPMGSRLTLPADAPLTFQVEVKDGGQADRTYEATLISGTVRPQTRQTLRELRERDGAREPKPANQAGIVTFEGHLASGDPEFYYVVVKQSDDDRAWSAPVWINHGPGTPGPGTPAAVTTFVWTSGNSRFFHKEGCVAAAQIRRENVMRGPMPPDGRQLHDCRFPSVADNH